MIWEKKGINVDFPDLTIEKHFFRFTVNVTESWTSFSWYLISVASDAKHYLCFDQTTCIFRKLQTGGSFVCISAGLVIL